MQVVLITFILAIFAALLFLNIYFRVKVFKAYKVLVMNRVDFKPTDIFNKKKLADEVVPKYPQYETEIWNFANNIRNSVRIASLLIVLITAFAAVLMFVKE